MNEPITTLLVTLVTFGISLWAFHNPQVQERLIFRPECILAGKDYYRLLTSSFLHAGWGHLLLNLYTLNQFGGSVEHLFGPVHFLVIYFGSVMGGGLLSLYLHRYHDYAALGASGGVCGVIFAHILGFPTSQMSVFPLPIPVPGWLFAILFLIASFLAMKSRRDNIGHDAHLGGAIIGLLVTGGLHPSLVRQHWAIFGGLVLLSSLVFAYVAINPLFLPVSCYVTLPKWGRSAPQRPRSKRSAATAARARPVIHASTAPAAVWKSEPDWLMEAIEEQVGKLDPDRSGLHDWIDKFGRAYDVVGGKPETFKLETFKAAVMDHLNASTVKFVIVDTRRLAENQVNLLRPFFADLPDAQFNRLIRSYGFNPRQRR